MSQHDETTPIETMLDDESADQERRQAEAAAPRVGATGSTAAAQAAPTASSADPEPPGPSAPAGLGQPTPYRGEVPPLEYKSGPAPTTSVVGLLGLLTAIAVIVAQATDLDIPWGVVGPVAVVGAGVLLVVLGLAGLRGQRFRG